MASSSGGSGGGVSGSLSDELDVLMRRSGYESNQVSSSSSIPASVALFNPTYMSEDSSRSGMGTGPAAVSEFAVVRSTNAAAAAKIAALKRTALPLLIAVLPFATGYALGYTSPAVPSLREDGRINNAGEEANLAAMLPLGALGGALAAGHGADRFGRRWAVALAACAFSLGWTIFAGRGITFGRLLTGVGCGASTTVGPTYIAELAPTRLRGICGAGFQLCLTIGILAVYSAGADDKQDKGTWARLAVGGVIPPTILLLAGAALLPESPRFLHMVGKDADAARVLQELHGGEGTVGTKNLVAEAQVLARTAAPNANGAVANGTAATLQSTGGMSTEQPLWRRLANAWRPLCIGIGLSIAQQFSGINAVVFFAGEILLATGIGHDANDVAVGVAVIQVLATFAGVLLVERMGRRPLLLASSTLMASACFAIAATAEASSATAARVTAAALMLYMVGFSTGMGPVPWLMLSELMPQNVRGGATGLVAAINWICGMACAATFPVLFAFSPSTTFGLYGGVCLCAIAFVRVAVPETKGRSLESLEVELAAR
ncbi:sugar transporter [Pseudoscourfieldia marina]